MNPTNWRNCGTSTRCSIAFFPCAPEILDGDLRPPLSPSTSGRRVGWHNHDPDEERDAPVPAGLDQLTDAHKCGSAGCTVLARLWLRPRPRIAQRLPAKRDSANPFDAWLRGQPDATKNAWLAELMRESTLAVRREILAEYRKSLDVSSWPTVRVDRTIAELMAAAEEIQSEMGRQKAEKAARQRG